MSLELLVLQSEMRELPLHVELRHLREVGRSDRFVHDGISFGGVEGLSKRFARKFHPETSVKRDEAILPMQAVAIEGAAHVEKDRAKHWRKFSRLEAGEKPAIRVALPKPEDDESQIHRHQDESEKEIDPVQTDQDADGKEPGVVTEEIPAAN